VQEFNGKGRPWRHGHAGARGRQLPALEASSKGAFIEGGGSSAAPVTSGCGRGRRGVARGAIKLFDRASAYRDQFLSVTPFALRLGKSSQY
jgi:hypothetical protein